MCDNEEEDPVTELVGQVGEAVEGIAEQIPGLSKRLDAITSKFNKIKPELAQGLKITSIICR